MRFLNPAGLFLLLGIPILILIYIIKSKHEDKAVSSTYIWKLSERFNKRKLPLQKFKKILLFVLRLLAVTAIALLVSKPALTNISNKDYILIVDTSASMKSSSEKDGETRFDRAIRELETMADKVNQGHTVSIISAGDESAYVIRNSTNLNEIRLAIKNIVCSEGSFDLEKAIELSSEVSSLSTNPQVIVYTDFDCIEEKNDHAEIINLSTPSDSINLAVESLGYVLTNGGTEFYGSVFSRGVSSEVVVALRLDGEIVDAVKITCKDGEKSDVTFKEKVTSFKKAEIFINREDSLSIDNSFVLIKEEPRARSVLLIGKTPFYLKKALSALENVEVTSVPELADAELSGFDVYIFDGIAPQSAPSDGSAIYIASGNLPNGASFGEKIEILGDLSATANSYEIGRNLIFDGTVISKYSPLLCNASWESILTVGENVVMAAKEYPSGYTHTVIGFDLHDSNMPLKPYFISLIKQLISFSAPDIVSTLDASVGERVFISPPAGCTELLIEEPDGDIRELDRSAHKGEYIPRNVGVYSLAAVSSDGDIDHASFFAHVPVGETEYRKIESLPVIVFNETPDVSGRDAVSEIAFWVALVLLILLLAEWGVYYYEQY